MMEEKLVYSKHVETLIEIAELFSVLMERDSCFRRKAEEIDSISWKQKFVDWANEFEDVNGSKGGEWEEDWFLPEIEKFAARKFAEFSGEIEVE